MGITLGGLATGMDTNAIVDALVDVRRGSIRRLESRKEESNARLDATKTFDAKLDALMLKVDGLDTARDLLARKATPSTEDYLKTTASSTAAPGSYEIKVGQLAQVEKVVYQGVADKATTTFGVGTIRLDQDGLSAENYPAGYVDITIDETNNTLEGIRDAINAESSKHGVTASIVNDGSGTPYRLVLTGKTVSDANITLDTSNLTGGATFPVKDAAVSRSAQKAIVQVDGITITSDSNTLSEAIPGVTLDLTQAKSGFNPLAPDWSSVPSTQLNVTTDTDGIKKKVEEFVAAFNDLVKASKDDAIARDTGVQAVLRTLRGKLYDSTDGTGLYQLGVKTLKDGTLEIDSTKLSNAVSNNLDVLQELLAGDGTTGIAGQLKSSLTSFTSPTTGLLASRQSIIESSIRSIDKEISRSEDQLTAYEEGLRQKFSAMEQLVSSLNSQGSYLAQQANVWSNLSSR